MFINLSVKIFLSCFPFIQIKGKQSRFTFNLKKKSHGDTVDICREKGSIFIKMNTPRPRTPAGTSKILTNATISKVSQFGVIIVVYENFFTIFK